MSLTINHQQHENGVVVIEVKGEITFDNSDEFRDAIDQLCSQDKFFQVIDLTGLKYMSSAGMGVLVHGLKQTRLHEGDLRLANLNDKMKRIFMITQFTHHFLVYQTVDEAIASFKAKESGR